MELWATQEGANGATSDNEMSETKFSFSFFNFFFLTLRPSAAASNVIKTRDSKDVKKIPRAHRRVARLQEPYLDDGV